MLRTIRQRRCEWLIELEEVSIPLKDHPRIGTARDDIAKGMRVFPVGSDLILFRSLDNGVEIVRYVRGARQLRGLARDLA